MTMSNQEPADEGIGERLDGPGDPLPSWARTVAFILGLGGLGAGGYGVFVSDNQAGTALLLIVGAVLALLGIQGTPIRRFGSGDHSFELRDIARKAARESAEASSEGLTERASALAEVARSIDPGVPVQSEDQ
ncbi:hypothetical protein, partial [Actinoplanes philippinensis]|uniref:hypothetical protein n=1 Tax=Actinoplanes philippinensis TaxID=35752 RepID=UPI0033FC94CA